MPGWFTIRLLGQLQSGWAVVVEKEGEERIFVVETKGGLLKDDLREKEKAKIDCGKVHFNAIAEGDSPAHYIVARNIEDVLTS